MAFVRKRRAWLERNGPFSSAIVESCRTGAGPLGVPSALDGSAAVPIRGGSPAIWPNRSPRVDATKTPTVRTRESGFLTNRDRGLSNWEAAPAGERLAGRTRTEGGRQRASAPERAVMMPSAESAATITRPKHDWSAYQAWIQHERDVRRESDSDYTAARKISLIRA